VSTRSIPFYESAVRAVLDGRKTQTRCVVEPQPTGDTTMVEWNIAQKAFVPWHWMSGVGSYAGGRRTGKIIRCPYGLPGDRLRVRGWTTNLPLEVTGVRMERVQDISIDDCLAEGVGADFTGPFDPQESGPEPDFLFARLWDDINAKRGCSWNENPWVWVIEFKRVAK